MLKIEKFKAPSVLMKWGKARVAHLWAVGCCQALLQRENPNGMLQGVNLDMIAGNAPHILQSFCLLPRTFIYQEQASIITLKLLAALCFSEGGIKNKLEVMIS